MTGPSTGPTTRTRRITPSPIPVLRSVDVEQDRLRHWHQRRAEKALQQAERTIWTSDCAMPHSTDAITKPATAAIRTCRRPNLLTRKPDGGVMIAAATMYDVSTQLI